MRLQFRKPSGRNYEALVQPHLDRLYRLAYRFTGSPHDAEDLVQDLLLKLMSRQEKLLQVDQLGPWLARALHHLYVDRVRRKTILPVDLAHSAGDEVMEQIPEERSATPEQAAEQMLSQRRLTAALESLSPKHRAIIAWHDIEGYTLQELSDEHDVPVGTLKSRLHRARQALREYLKHP